jgi:hypothetical protein
LKSFVLFVALGVIGYFNLVDNVYKFVAFFGLGFTALMVFEIKYIYKEFGKE